MKKIYLLFLLIAVFGFNKISAQNPACPDASTVIPLTTEEVYVIFNAPGPLCVNRPTTISIDGSTYAIGNCDEFTSQYILTSGAGVIDPNIYTIAYGTSNCEYTNNVLPIEDFKFLNATLKVYPNPVMKNNRLNVKFATNITANIYIYDLTGKLAYSDEMNNANRKQINTSSLANGVYLLKMATENVSITRKVVIMK
jgi:hypothetical protein